LLSWCDAELKKKEMATKNGTPLISFEKRKGSKGEEKKPIRKEMIANAGAVTCKTVARARGEKKG